MSIDEISLFQRRSPVGGIHPVIEPAVLVYCTVGEEIQRLRAR